MYTVLLVLHILAAVLFLGPITVAVSAFPGQADRARAGDVPARGAVRLLHRITVTYGVLSALVPVVGVIMMFTDPGLYWRQGRLHLSLVLAIIAWVLLIVVLIPRQRAVTAALGMLDPGEGEADRDAVGDPFADWERQRRRMAAHGGIFSALWVVILLLMVGPVW